MSEHTHCDRCGHVDDHKGENTVTNEFPGMVALRQHPDNSGMLVHTRHRELCADCTVKLAEFLHDADLVDEVTPEGHEETEDLPDVTR